MVVAVMAAAALGGARPALISTAIGLVAGAFFVSSSFDPTVILEPSRLLQFALFVVACLGIAYVAEALRRSRGLVERHAEEQATLARQLGEVNEAKDRLLAAVSHDLRTPLNAILGWASLLDKGVLDHAQTKSALATIQRSARQQEQLIADLLDMARSNAGQLRLRLQRLEPLTIVQDAVDAVRPAAIGKTIRLAIEGGRVGAMAADRERLQQVLWNLLSNAIEFTPAGGEVVVNVGATDADVRLTVKDTGAGIPADFLPHVFDSFRQATDNPRGLGLGLAITREIVEMHRGTIRATNVEPHGAMFEVVLPRGLESLGDSGAAA